MQHNVNWNPGMSLDEVQKMVIFKALEFYKDKLTASNSLKIPLKKLEKKLEEYQIERDMKDKQEAARRINQEQFQLRYRGFVSGNNISK